MYRPEVNLQAISCRPLHPDYPPSWILAVFYLKGGHGRGFEPDSGPIMSGGYDLKGVGQVLGFILSEA